ncbi:DNL zinc finger-domain-containing protein [Xylariaceae sp. FL1651]|nr:DNL zinc finger-domain-containing protein [Xylariaceae sp. FL1651]
MASRTVSRCLTSNFRTSKTIFPLLRPYPRLPRTLQPSVRRLVHTIPRPPQPSSEDTSEASSSTSSETIPRKLLEPHYNLSFTCVPCGSRSHHQVSKQGYHKGSVLITCPDCRNRHVISDNLNIFGDRKITVEDILREKGQLVKRGTLGEDGNIELWQEDAEGAAAKFAEDEAARKLREDRDPSKPARFFF